MTKPKGGKRTVRAWALIQDGVVQHDVNTWHQAYGNLYVFKDDSLEELKKCNVSPLKEKGEIIVPCTITYRTPKRGKK